MGLYEFQSQDKVTRRLDGEWAIGMDESNSGEESLQQSLLHSEKQKVNGTNALYKEMKIKYSAGGKRT